MPVKSKGPGGLLVTLLFVGAFAIASLFSGLGHGSLNAASILGGVALPDTAGTSSGW